MYYLTADICVFPETQKCILHSSVDHKLSKGTKSVRVNLELMSMKQCRRENQKVILA